MTLPPDQPVQVEVPVLSVRRHGRHLALPVLFLFAIAVAAGFWVGGLPEAWMNWAAGAGAVLLAVVLGIGPILSWLVTRSTVTSRRVIQRYGVVVHHRNEVPLSRVRSVNLTRGPVQRMFGSGDVHLLVGAEDPVVLSDVPGCTAIVDALQELVEQNFVLHGGSAHSGPQHAAPGGFGAPGASGPLAGPGGSDPTTILPRF